MVLFHGLEGRSHDARALMHALRETGWRGVVAHFRGCSGEANRRPSADHAGDSAEIAPCLAHLRPRAGSAPLYAVGMSSGGNALLKWLRVRRSRHGIRHTRRRLRPARQGGFRPDARPGNEPPLCLALPVQLETQNASEAPPTGVSWDTSTCAGSRACAFDDRITAPMHGLRDALDYWQRSSAKPLLPAIHVPTLILHARNDP